MREQSLRWHLALAAFQAGQGNGELLVKLVKALYLAWYLQQAGFGALERDLYLDAERLLDAAARNASEDSWLIAAADCAPLARFLGRRCGLTKQALLPASPAPLSRERFATI